MATSNRSLKSLTLSQLAGFRGDKGSRKIYLAIKGEVFDVTDSRRLYGKGGAYERLAGREIARALATFELKEAGSDQTGDLGEEQLLSLKEWTDKFRSKYKRVGKIAATVPLLDWKMLLPIAAIAFGATAVALVVLRKK